MPLSSACRCACGVACYCELPRTTFFSNRSKNFDVYDTWSEERACRCIAKVPRPDRVGDPTVSQRLIREGQLLERLTHLHIVRAYETIDGPRPTLILETLTGETLEHMIETRQRRLPLRSIIVLGIQLCSAMHYPHHHGVLHLDPKPSNVVSERQSTTRHQVQGCCQHWDDGPGRQPARPGPRPYQRQPAEEVVLHSEELVARLGNDGGPGLLAAPAPSCAYSPECLEGARDDLRQIGLSRGPSVRAELRYQGLPYPFANTLLSKRGRQRRF